MGMFRSHRDVARATNRVIGGFFLVMALWTIGFAALVAGHYLLGWW